MFAIITGAIFPILFIVFGDITDVLTQKEAMPNMSDDIFMDGIIQVEACQDVLFCHKCHIQQCVKFTSCVKNTPLKEKFTIEMTIT